MGLLALTAAVATVLLATSAKSQGTSPDCPGAASWLYLPDGPQANYFYSDCHAATHVIVTSPRVGDNLNIVKPRLIVAWPAGNSGILALFEPGSGQPGTLAVSSATNADALSPVYEAGGTNPRVGVSGTISFNDSAILAVPVLGSIRSIRDYIEGGNIDQSFQNSFGFAENADGSASINRTWFDGVTTSTIRFTPQNGAQKVTVNRDAAWTLGFGHGSYTFEASYNYPQLDQLSPQEVLNSASTALIGQMPDQTTSLSFLSYSNKLLAGTWRFLTYFGRDSMISMMLMQDTLSQSAIEAVISAVLERVNRTDGTVCHEEVLGDYATYLNRKKGIDSTQPGCDYKMIDTDFMLPIAIQRYFFDTQPGQQSSGAFFARKATFLVENNGLTYTQLAQFTAEKIMRIAAPFAASQTQANLIHLRDGEQVGEWRDSNNGLGGGRTPYNVNAALVPAGLRAIAAMSRAGFFPDHADWKNTADSYAQTWEDSTLRFFEVNVRQADAKARVQNYVSAAGLNVPAHAENITSDVKFYGLAVDGSINSGGPVPVMNTDDAFRHFFLNTTNDTQLSSFLDQSASHILAPFPAGLSTDVGLVVANPAYADNAGFAAGFSNTNYHGTVVWSWQLAVMGKGLGMQLGRCQADGKPAFCSDSQLHGKVLAAYNKLWDTIDANKAQLSQELWSWDYSGGKYSAVPFGSVTSTESNVRQLWSLTFLSVHRERF
ncbi:hypothetical protein EK21DRAFT_61144 [Setomelanomma holmii]|uniref:Glycogen debranching enzyme n=1 Tax=Setomelanomma holmii TaxID=210430 RepID=A0A9P4HD52_9PLEO|nr:hypothetical protein EK21DRAFT_61144 [Setomelanomma holmii]